MKKFEIVKDLNNKYIVRIHDGKQILKEYKPMTEERTEIVKNQLFREGYTWQLMGSNEVIENMSIKEATQI